MTFVGGDATTAKKNPDEKDSPGSPGICRGEGGIRTPGTLAGTSDFESGAFNHSATSPLKPAMRRFGPQIYEGSNFPSKFFPIIHSDKAKNVGWRTYRTLDIGLLDIGPGTPGSPTSNSPTVHLPVQVHHFYLVCSVHHHFGAFLKTLKDQGTGTVVFAGLHVSQFESFGGMFQEYHCLAVE